VSDEPAVESGQAWRLVVVAGVEMHLPAANPEVLLREAGSPWRELRIPVGLAEGTAIAQAFHGVASPRPLTHALVATLLESHEVHLEAMRITGRIGKVFVAEIETVGPRGRQVVDCRPSDAMALVLRSRLPAPMLVAEELFGPVS
jgi:bifunctional DNase/RNase